MVKAGNGGQRRGQASGPGATPASLHQAAGERGKGGICPFSQVAEGRQRCGRRDSKGGEEKEGRGRDSNTLGKGKDPQGDFWEEAERCVMESSLCSTKPSVEARQFFRALGIAFIFLVVGLDHQKPGPALR